MRLGIKTDDVFLIELNEKNTQVQNLFLEKIKKITKNYSIDVMLQDGIIKKQQTFDVQKIDSFTLDWYAALMYPSSKADGES